MCGGGWAGEDGSVRGLGGVTVLVGEWICGGGVWVSKCIGVWIMSLSLCVWMWKVFIILYVWMQSLRRMRMFLGASIGGVGVWLSM